MNFLVGQWLPSVRWEDTVRNYKLGFKLTEFLIWALSWLLDVGCISVPLVWTSWHRSVSLSTGSGTQVIFFCSTCWVGAWKDLMRTVTKKNSKNLIQLPSWIFLDSKVAFLGLWTFLQPFKLCSTWPTQQVSADTPAACSEYSAPRQHLYIKYSIHFEYICSSIKCVWVSALQQQVKQFSSKADRSGIGPCSSSKIVPNTGYQFWVCRFSFCFLSHLQLCFCVL